MQCPFWISFSIFLLQNFNFGCCLERFHLRIALNVLKYALFGHTTCMSYLSIITWLWYFSDVNFCMTCFFHFCICICLALIKEINSFFCLKLDVLYLLCVEGYQPSANYPHRRPPNLCHSRDFRLEVHNFQSEISTTAQIRDGKNLFLFAETTTEISWS